MKDTASAAVGAQVDRPVVRLPFGGPVVEVTPWTFAFEALPLREREGRYQVRFCVGWREVFVDWRKGGFWLRGGPLDKPQRVRLSRWPGFHWRGAVNEAHNV